MSEAHTKVVDVSTSLLEPVAQQVLRAADKCATFTDCRDVYEAGSTAARMWSDEVSREGTIQPLQKAR